MFSLFLRQTDAPKKALYFILKTCSFFIFISVWGFSLPRFVFFSFFSCVVLVLHCVWDSRVSRWRSTMWFHHRARWWKHIVGRQWETRESHTKPGDPKKWKTTRRKKKQKKGKSENPHEEMKIKKLHFFKIKYSVFFRCVSLAQHKKHIHYFTFRYIWMYWRSTHSKTLGKHELFLMF